MKYKKRISLLLILVFLKVNEIVPFYYMGVIVNKLQEARLDANIKNDFLVFALSTLVIVFLTPIFTYFFEKEIQEDVATKSIFWFESIIRKPFFYIKNIGLGSLSNKLDRGISSYEKFINLTVSTALPIFLKLIILSFSILYFSGFYVFLSVALISFFSILLQRKVIEKRRDSIDKVNDAEDLISDNTVLYIKGLRTIQSNRAHDFFIKKMTPFFMNYKKAAVSLSVSRSLLNGVNTAAYNFSPFFIVFLFVFFWVPSHEKNIGDLVTALFLVREFFSCVSSAMETATALDQTNMDFKGVKEIIDKNENDIREDDVDFLFPDVDLSFIERREPINVVITGKSGVGKTSFLERLVGLSSKNIKTLSNATFLEQDSFIFSGSVYENITLGKDVPKNYLEDLLAKSGLSNRLTLETFINGNGNNLSGGEKRRLSFLRTIVMDSKIIILDEPTSGLDSQTSEEIWNVIFNLTKGKILIVVTHDKSIFYRFDKVITLERVSK